jgi:hypothetical protein
VADNKDPLENQVILAQGLTPYSVMIPCSQEDFVQFISGLLGKPQTIGKIYHESFEITKSDIENTFHIVDQRICQQNEANPIQFTVRITYDDDSFVLLNTLQDFIHYAEVKPLISVTALLTWTYLIRFQDKKVSEKQQIEVHIISDHSDVLIHLDEGVHVIKKLPPYGRGFIATTINHTARTWGADIDSLLSGHFKTLFRHESKIRRWAVQYSKEIGFGVMILFMLVVGFNSKLSTKYFLTQQMDTLKKFLLAQEGNPEALSATVNFLLEMVAKGSWAHYTLQTIGFAFIVTVLGVLLGRLVGLIADNRLSSFLLLSKKAEEQKAKILQREKRQWIGFIGSLSLSVVGSVIASMIFSIYLEHLVR